MIISRPSSNRIIEICDAEYLIKSSQNASWCYKEFIADFRTHLAYNYGKCGFEIIKYTKRK